MEKIEGRKPIPQQQTCKACGQLEKFDFAVPDRIWSSVVPPRLRTGAVCLYCFDEFAREANVNYADSISAVYFAGTRGCFVFTVASAADLP